MVRIIKSNTKRDAILREIISDSLAHRDYSSHYIARMVIEKDKIITENGNRAHGMGILNIKTFQPFPKNPPISKIFREIGYADELGSGMRNCYKYSKLYSGGEPEFIEGDIFKIIIPLTTGAMTKVGPSESIEHSGIKVDVSIEQLSKILDFCNEPRTRVEIQEFCGYKSAPHFREKILKPLLDGGQLVPTIPDRPKSPNQKYVRKTAIKT